LARPLFRRYPQHRTAEIMLKQNIERDDDSKKSHHALVPLFDLKFLIEFAASDAGTSNRH
jgi:hypothetical protein